MKSEDYINIGYDRGHLVPNAYYGSDTYIITNSVPMLRNFNRGVWRISEQMSRDKYKDKMIYKSCEYSNKYVMTSINNKLYILDGCYYVIFDTNNVNQTLELEILDYGYLKNENTTQISEKNYHIVLDVKLLIQNILIILIF